MLNQVHGLKSKDDVGFSSLSAGPTPKSEHEVHFRELGRIDHGILTEIIW